MNSKLPEVSIGMPVFNDVHFIEMSILSIINQSFSDFELILSDDGSTDGSAEICKQYAAADNRIKYIRQEKNIGISRNMEFLLHKSVGKYFMWAGNDDLLAPDFIKTLKSKLEERSDTILAFCTTDFIDDDGKFLYKEDTDYEGNSAQVRIKKLIYEFKDACGYGLFIKSEIEKVKFPIWISVNKKRAYNNIYPTICFYLAKGNYVLVKGEALFFKRIKKVANHYWPYTKSLVKFLAAFYLWKINLVLFSLKQIYRASSSIILVLRIFPVMFKEWFLKPSIKETKFRWQSFRNKRIKFY